MEKDRSNKIQLPERLKLKLLEATPVGDFDAIATHLFWLVEKKGQVVPSIRGRLLILAAAMEYYRQEKKPVIILTTGKVWGDDSFSVAETAKKELVEKYAISEEKIIIELTDEQGKPNRETTAEIEAINKTSQGRILKIAEPAHLKTIIDLHNGFYNNDNVVFRNTDEILGDETLKGLIPKLRHSIYEYNLKSYEFAKRCLIKYAGYTPEKFKQGAKSRNKKGSPLPKFLATEPRV